jgi:allantoin racemase
VLVQPDAGTLIQADGIAVQAPGGRARKTWINRPRVAGRIGIITSNGDEMTATPGVSRIANLLPPGGREKGYDVPAWAVGAGFTSEIVETATQLSFLNDLDYATNELLYADAGRRAHEAGFDAVLINTVLDYGIRPLRAVLDIPVVGAGQASLQVATGLADSLGILTVWPQATRRHYDRLLRDYGFESRCVGIEHVTGNDELASMAGHGGVIDEMRDGRTEVIDRIERAGRTLLENGAEVIVLGCTCMSPVRAELSARLGRPVVDGLVAGQKVAETLLTLGLTHAGPAVPPVHADLARAMATGGDITVEPVADLCGNSCAVMHDSSETVTAGG